MNAMQRAGAWVTKRVGRVLQSVPGSQSWFPWVREPYTGAWQRNDEWTCQSVLAHPTVYACVTQIANDFGKLRQRLAEKGKRDVWREVTSPSPFHRVLRKPNRYQNQIQFKQWWMTSLLIWGNAYALKRRDERGVVTHLYLLDPCRVMPSVAPDGSIFYQLSPDNLTGLETEIMVPASEIIHDRVNCLWHPLIGIPPIYAAGLAAHIGLTILGNTSSFFANDSQPSGILMVPGSIDPEKAKTLREKWDSGFTGANRGKVAVVGDGVKYQPTRQTAVESQTVQSSEWLDEKICSAFHMPKYKVGVGPYPTFNNIEALAQEYYSGCLQILIEQYEAVMDEGLGLEESKEGKQLGVDLDLSPLLRMDRASLITSLGEATSKTLMTFNEARGELGLPDIEGGDSLWMQEQNYQVTTLLERDAEDPFAKPDPVPPTPPAESNIEGEEDVDKEDVELIAKQVAKEIFSEMLEEHLLLNPPQKGEKGEKGDSPTDEEIEGKCLAIIDRIPMPSDGKSVTMEDVVPVIEVGLAKGLLDLERRATETLQRACEAIPKPKDGVDGKDGMGFDDLTADYDGDRLLTLSLTRGDEVKDFTLTLPIPIYRGLYSVDKQYQLGDNTTWAGAMWISMKDAPAGEPGSEGSDWAQAVKRGDRGKKGEVITVPATYKFGDQK